MIVKQSRPEPSPWPAAKLSQSTDVAKWKLLSRVWFFAAPWTVAHQAPLSMVFPRQEYRSGLPFPSPGDLPDLGIEPRSSPLQVDSSSRFMDVGVRNKCSLSYNKEVLRLNAANRCLTSPSTISFSALLPLHASMLLSLPSSTLQPAAFRHALSSVASIPGCLESRRRAIYFSIPYLM